MVDTFHPEMTNTCTWKKHHHQSPRVLHQSLCLGRQARRIQQVGGWMSMGFLDPSWTVQGGGWWASTPALPLGRQQLGKGTHSPLLHLHVKRGRNWFSLVCPGFVHRQPMYHCRPIPLCQQPSLGVKRTTLYDWVSSSSRVPQKVPEAWCKEQRRAAYAAGGQPACGL